MRKSKYFSFICGGIMLLAVFLIDCIDDFITANFTLGKLDATQLYEQYGNMANFPGYPHTTYLPVVAMSILSAIAVILIYLLFKKLGLQKTTLSKEIIAVTCSRCIVLFFMLYMYWYDRAVGLDSFGKMYSAIAFTDQYGFYVRYIRLISYVIILGLMVKEYIKVKSESSHSKTTIKQESIDAS